MCSAISSARHLVLGLDLLLQKLDPLLFGLMVRAALALEGGSAVLEELFLPAVEYRWLQPQFLTQIGNRHLIQQVPPQDGDLLFCRCSAFALFSCVLSAILTEERPLQFQLRQDNTCVCNGENGNCRYCGGSGIMEDRLRPAFDETLRRRAIEESPTEDIKASPRPWWFPSNISVTPPPKWIKCPKGCGRWVDIQREQSHITNCTGVRATPAEKTKPTPPSNTKTEEARPEQVTSDKDPTRQDTTFVAGRDKNLDATKLYAHAYREQGKYGSHPSHDGFDDESEPRLTNLV